MARCNASHFLVVCILSLVVVLCVVPSADAVQQDGIFEAAQLGLKEVVRRGFAVEDQHAWSTLTGETAAALHKLGLSFPSSVGLPVPFSVIFIGFNHDGHRSLDIKESDLAGWFSSLMHSAPATRVHLDHATLTKDDQVFKPNSTHVNYDYRIRVLEMEPVVTRAVEAVIWQSMRPEHPWNTNPDHPDANVAQVDAEELESMFDSLSKSLGLKDEPVLFVINPKLPAKDVKYGYRFGFSQPELNRMKKNMTLLGELLENNSETVTTYPSDNVGKDGNLHQAASSWARAVLETLNEDSHEEVIFHEDDEGTASKKQVFIPRFLRMQNGAIPKDYSFHKYASNLLHAEEPSSRLYTRQSVFGGGTSAPCLSDLWVGSRRVAWVDLSAGPFEWGPTVGGAGTRSRLSLPCVDDLSLAQFIMSKDKSVEDSVLSLLRKESGAKEAIEQELAITEAAVEKNCRGQMTQGLGEQCQTLVTRMLTLQSLVKQTVGNAADHDSTGHFEDQLHLSAEEKAGMESIFNHTMVLDQFLAQISVVVSSFQSQVLTPPISSLPIAWHRSVAVTLYIVSNHDLFAPDAQSAFPVKDFKKQVLKLKAPGQQMRVSVQRIKLDEDAGLSVAYQRSLKSALVGQLTPEGKFLSTKRLYLDSAVLQDHLKAIQKHNIADDGSTSDLFELPVFLFSIDSALPVFIDKTLRARALEDMVIATQSRDMHWQTSLSCGSKAVTWDLRQPLRDVLASVAQSIAGLPPRHVHAYVAEDGSTKGKRDYLWSVGRCPTALMQTATGNFSAFASDAGARNYITLRISDAVKASSAAVIRLGDLVSSQPSVVDSKTLKEIQAKQSSVQSAIEETKSLLAMEKLAPAAYASRKAKDLSEELFQMCDRASIAAQQTLCSKRRARRNLTGIDWILAGSVGFVCLTAVSFYLSSPAKGRKAKSM